MKSAPPGQGTNMYVAGAVRSAGQPDLTWEIGEETMKSFFATWKNLSPHPGGPLPSPQPGYAGCFLRYSSEVEFFMYDGMVTLMTPTQSESRIDQDRKLERLILSFAPPNLPPS